MSIVMTSAELKQKLLNIVNRPNYYYNEFPYNLGYYNGYAISFDCWNLVKALINDPNIDQNYTYGYHAPAVGNMGDWDGWTILQHCSDISTDFTRIFVGEYLYMAGHAGVYIGNGLVVECTCDCEGGCLISRITSSGARYRNGVYGRSWTYHGKLTEWIDYNIKPSGKIDEDGEWGMETTRLVQKVMRKEYPQLDVDGIISSQEIAQKKYLLNADTSSWEFVAYPLGSPTIMALQNRLNQLGYDARKEDGIAGYYFVKALQNFLIDRGYDVGEDGDDGYMGYNTVIAYQRFLNSLVD